MDLFLFLKPKEKLDQELLEKLNRLGFDGDMNADGSFTLRAPDGIEYGGTLEEKKLRVKFKQNSPYKILFSYSLSGHYVNDPNPEGYRLLIDSLRASRAPAGGQNAVMVFLLSRYGA